MRCLLMPSSVIRHFRYSPEEKRLEILFVTGRRYSYHNVPAALYDDMRQAFSKGEFFNAHIRDHFRFTLENGELPDQPQRHGHNAGRGHGG